jgi:hypothetical protein
MEEYCQDCELQEADSLCNDCNAPMCYRCLTTVEGSSKWRCDECHKKFTKKPVCWYCFHPYDDEGVHAPSRYSQKLKKFICRGYFCQFGCAENWIPLKELPLLQRMAKEIYGIKKIKHTPKRTELAWTYPPEKDGTKKALNIKDFRSGEVRIDVINPPFILQQPDFWTYYTDKRKLLSCTLDAYYSNSSKSDLKNVRARTKNLYS